MNQEELRQRIHYLLQHGGIYPRQRPAWLPWAVVLVALSLVHIALELLR